MSEECQSSVLFMTHLFLYNDDRRVAFFRHFLNLEIHFLNNYLQSRGKEQNEKELYLRMC